MIFHDDAKTPRAPAENSARKASIAFCKLSQVPNTPNMGPFFNVLCISWRRFGGIVIQIWPYYAPTHANLGAGALLSPRDDIEYFRKESALCRDLAAFYSEIPHRERNNRCGIVPKWIIRMGAEKNMADKINI